MRPLIPSGRGKPVKPSMRFLIGGSGAIAPFVIGAITVDLAVVLSDLTLLAFLGWAVRLVIYFLIGGGYVLIFNKTVEDQAQIFQLGIIAPALLAGFINASESTPEVPTAGAPTGIRHGSFSLVPSAHAQAQPRLPIARTTPVKLRKFTPPPESNAQQFLRGLFGSRSNRRYYVIVGSHRNIRKAQEQANRINTTQTKFRAYVYDRFGGNPYYAVVIGAHLTLSKAKKLRSKAVRAGFPKDTYYWAYPRY